MNKYFTCTIVFLLVSFAASSQRILVLEKTGKFRNIQYQEGQAINIQLDDGEIISGIITSLQDSMLQLNDKTAIPLRYVEKVLRKQTMFQFLAHGAIIGGLTYFVLTAFNRTTHKEYPLLPVEDVAASAAAIGSGLLLKQFKYKKYNLKKNWRLKILDFSL